MYEGSLVRLRALENSDLIPLTDFSNDYAVMRGASGAILYPSTAEDTGRDMSRSTSYTSGEYQFAIETKEHKRFIGKCGFTRVNWKNRLAELAILIGDGAYRGKGYGEDAVRLLIRFGFEEMNLRKLEAYVFDFNEAALRCYEKCGFRREAVLKKEMYREGAYHDVVILTLFRDAEE